MLAPRTHETASVSINIANPPSESNVHSYLFIRAASRATKDTPLNIKGAPRGTPICETKSFLFRLLGNFNGIFNYSPRLHGDGEFTLKNFSFSGKAERLWVTSVSRHSNEL